MEADNNGTAPAARIKYRELDWCDCIEGTKEQLQALGLGIGLAFPGEVGGPRFDLLVRDPRGFPVRITNRCREREESFTAYIRFPGWPEMPSWSSEWGPEVHGVKKREGLTVDEYVGSEGALAAAGLVRPDQLPGKPGMRKVRVTILPDGTLPIGGRTASTGRAAGIRWIERANRSAYSVSIRVTEEVGTRRLEAHRAANAKWVLQVRALPRPARLQPIAQSKWEHLEAASASAARDIAFQGMLARIVSSASKRPGGKSP
jgi:hypothetical protein